MTLLEFVAKHIGKSESQLLQSLSDCRWADSDQLDDVIRHSWEALPIEAKLIAFLYASEMAENNAARLDRYDR